MPVTRVCVFNKHSTALHFILERGNNADLDHKCKYIANKTYYNLIDEATKATLPEESYQRFMSFVRKFPTKFIDAYDTKLEECQRCSLLREWEFYKQNANKVHTHQFSKKLSLTTAGNEMLIAFGRECYSILVELSYEAAVMITVNTVERVLGLDPCWDRERWGRHPTDRKVIWNDL